MSDRTFFVEAPDGQTIVLSTDGGRPYRLQAPSRGIGWPTRINQYADSAGDGGTLRGSKYGMRPLDLQVLTYGTSRADMEQKINKLGSVLDPFEGTSKLVCTLPDGSRWDLPFDYQSGLEGDGQQSGDTYSRNTISLMCPQPFWVSREAVQFNVSVDSGGLADLVADLAELPVGRSSVLGEVEVFNPGDVEAPVEWTITGPADSASVQFETGGFTIDSPIGIGEVIRINSRTKRVTNAAGDNVYDMLGPAPKFMMLPPGETRMTLQMVGASGDAFIAGFFKPRRKAMY